MATKRYCDIDGAEIPDDRFTFDVDISISIRPNPGGYQTEPTIGGNDYTPVKRHVTDVCLPCARAIARLMVDRSNPPQVG